VAQPLCSVTPLLQGSSKAAHPAARTAVAYTRSSRQDMAERDSSKGYQPDQGAASNRGKTSQISPQQGFLLALLAPAAWAEPDRQGQTFCLRVAPTTSTPVVRTFTTIIREMKSLVCDLVIFPCCASPSPASVCRPRIFAWPHHVRYVLNPHLSMSNSEQPREQRAMLTSEPEPDLYQLHVHDPPHVMHSLAAPRSTQVLPATSKLPSLH
jgi:hypothetical protein